MPKEIFGPHYGGISEDDSLTSANQVLYTENLDITSNTKYVNLSRKPTSYITTTDDIIGMDFVNTGGVSEFMMTADKAKNIYKDGTIVWSGEKRIVKFWTNSTYLFMLEFGGSHIHKILLTDINQTDWSAYITSNSLTNSGNGPYSIIPLEDITYLAYNQNLVIIDNSAGAELPDTFDFISNDISGLTILGTTVKIYQSNGMLLLWGGIGNDGISERINLGIKIDAVYQIANIDYVVSSGQIGYMNGYTWTPLLNTFYSDELQSDKIEIKRTKGTMGIAHLKGIFYILGENSHLNLGNGTDIFGEKDCVITYGTKKQGFSRAINRYLTRASTGNLYEELFGVHVSTSAYSTIRDVLYVAYKDTAGNYGVDKYNLYDGNYICSSDKGVIVYNNFDGGNPFQKKKIKSVTIVGDISLGDSIELYYIDETKTSGDNMIPLPNKGSTDNYIFEFRDDLGKFSCNKPFDMSFYNITLAVILKDGGNSNKNEGLRYYNLILDYENI